MTPNAHVVKTVEKLAREKGRFSPEAYFFLLEALNFTLAERKKRGERGHICGAQLLEGLRVYACKSFGFLARTVFESWNVTSTAHFGDIVFDLVSIDLLSKQETDTKADFEGGFDFAAAFEEQFIHD